MTGSAHPGPWGAWVAPGSPAAQPRSRPTVGEPREPQTPSHQDPPRRRARARHACTARAARARPSSVPRSTERTVATGMVRTAAAGLVLLGRAGDTRAGGVRRGPAASPARGAAGTGRATCASGTLRAAAPRGRGGRPAGAVPVLVTSDVGVPAGAARLQAPGCRGAAPERAGPLLAAHPGQPGRGRIPGGGGLQPPRLRAAQLPAGSARRGRAGAFGADAAPRAIVEHLQVPAAAAAAARQPQGELLCKGVQGGSRHGWARPPPGGMVPLVPELGAHSTDLSRRLPPRHRAGSRAVPRPGNPRETPRSRRSHRHAATAAPCRDRSEPIRVPPAPFHSPAGGRRRWHPRGPSFPGRRCPRCRCRRPPPGRRSAPGRPPASRAGCLRGTEGTGLGRPLAVPAPPSPSRDTHLSRR